MSAQVIYLDASAKNHRSGCARNRYYINGAGIVCVDCGYGPE
jgi:hypothetical protein